MAVLKIKGSEETGIHPAETVLENASAEKIISLQVSRSCTSTVEIQVEPDDVFEIVTSDGLRWIVNGEELLEKYSGKTGGTRGAGAEKVYEFNNRRVVPGETRGIGDGIDFTQLIKWSVKPIVDALLPPLVEKIDRKLVPDEGLFIWDYKDRFTDKITAPAGIPVSDEVLLFIHGTITNAQGTFGNLFEGDADKDWETVKKRFANRVYAFQHHTLSQSPLQNALKLLAVLPDGLRINLVTSSRGGLIGELLMLFSVYKTQPAYLDNLLSYLREKERTDDVKVLEAIIALAATRSISITDYHRVACPAFGTTLVSGRLDRYLKVILNLIGFIPALKASGIYDLVKSLLLEVVKSKADTDILPGVEAMMPESPFIEGLNKTTLELDAGLKIFAGDVDPQGFLKTLAVFIVDAFYRADHDFIVNSYSMFGGVRRKNTQYIFHKGNSVSHFHYYLNPQTRSVLYSSLQGQLKPSQMNPLPPGIELKQNYLSKNAAMAISRGAYTDKLKKLNSNASGTHTVGYPPPDHTKIVISVKNSDLGYAMYPLIVGHIKDDGIVSSERAVDTHLNGRLSVFHKAGIYPGALETSEVFMSGRSGFKGAVVIGLGGPNELNGQALTSAFTHGAINLALKTPYNPDKKAIGISTLLVGSDYVGLSMRTVIRSMVDGIITANQQIRDLQNPKLPYIDKLEIVELFNDRAIIATKFINYLMEHDYKDYLEGTPPLILQKASGFQKRFPDDYSQDWWYRLQVDTVADKEGNINKLTYVLMHNSSKVDSMEVDVQGKLLQQVIKDSIANNVTDEKLSKLFFNMVIPPSLKEFTNDKRNILLILEGRSADIPWELLFNKTSETDEPITVKSGIIRQLKVETELKPVKGESCNRALIIGNPSTKGSVAPNNNSFADLQGASDEAAKVTKALRDNFQCVISCEQDFMGLMKLLYDGPYKVLHLAGHGLFGTEGDPASGMILSDGLRLGATDVLAMPYTPELVFINCCSLGKIGQSKVLWYQLAANLGSAFIKKGTKCVIAAGWEIDDAAATDFADEFYSSMLAGEYFGDTVKKARKYIYERYATENNTWGAYQCYGDPFYKLLPPQDVTGFKERSQKYIDVAELIMDLQNLIQQADPKSTRNKRGEILKFIDGKVKKVLCRPEWLEIDGVIEAFGNCYCELGEADKAIEEYKKLLSCDAGSFDLESLSRLSRLLMEKGVGLLTNNSSSTEGKELVSEANDISDKLLKLRNTSDLLILQGGNLKREASIYSGAKRIKTLKAAHASFKAAFLQSVDFGKYDHYPFYHWLVLDCILIEYGQAPDPGLLETDLEKVSEELRKNKKGVSNFGNLSAAAEMGLCRLLNRFGENWPIKADDIINSYKRGWQTDGSLSKATVILNQFKLNIKLFDEVQPKTEQNATITGNLEHILKNLEETFNEE